jgi:hypothetical protein
VCDGAATKRRKGMSEKKINITAMDFFKACDLTKKEADFVLGFQRDCEDHFGNYFGEYDEVPLKGLAVFLEKLNQVVNNELV